MSIPFRLASALSKLSAFVVAAHALTAAGRGAPLVSRVRRGGVICCLLVAGLLSLGASPAQASFFANGSIGSSDQFGFFAPLGAAVDQSSGDVYLGDTFDGRVEKFGSSGSYISQFSGTGNDQFNLVDGIAVDQSNGDVYVADEGDARVEKFDSSGNFILMFGGGVDQTTGGNVCTASSGDTCGAGTSGSGSGQFADGFAWLGNVAAVDPASGDVYVADTSNARVEKFDSSGNYLSQITTALNTPKSVVVDPSGNLFVADPGANAVEEYDSSGNFVASLASGTTPSAVATDASGDVFVFANSPTAEVIEYDPTGTQIDSVGSGALSSNSTTNSGIAFGNTAASLYIAQPNTSNALIYSEPSAPRIDSTYTENLSSSTATLGAQVNPDGADTTYHFEYGTSASYGTSVPATPADIGSGASDVAASQLITGLTADTVYHFRVVATNSFGTTTSADRTFVYDTSGGGLPDGRAYELVTPSYVEGSPVYTPAVSPDGSRVLATSLGAFAGSSDSGAAEGGEYLFSRTGSGWTTTALDPPPGAVAADENFDGEGSDLSSTLWDQPTAPGGEQDFYVRSADGSFTDVGPVTPPANGPLGFAATDQGSGFVAASPDLSDVLWSANTSASLWPFDTTVPYSPGTGQISVRRSLYEYAGAGNSTPSLVGVSGGAGSTSLISQCGTVLGGPEQDNRTGVLEADGALSNGGSKVFFTAIGADDASCSGTQPAVDQLFARVNGSSTVAISEPTAADCSACDTAGAGQADASFQAASTDGSKVFFTTAQPLLGSDTTESLYEYDADAPAGQRIVRVSTGDPAGARVQGVVAVSNDDSHVYFVADGVLTSTPNAQGQSAQEGEPNLYLYEPDPANPSQQQTVFVATLSASDASDWQTANNPLGSAKATPDGKFLVFESQADLTADDTSTVAQLFRYDAQTGALQRVSIGRQGGFNDDGNTDSSALSPSTFFVSDDGSYVFFQSADGLTPQALDAVPIANRSGGLTPNVYEWEPAGVGSCAAGEAIGCVYLISDGQDVSWNEQGETPSVQLSGISSSGSNVFFTSADSLVPNEDVDGNVAIYDARICTASDPCIPPPTAAAGCQGDTCQGSPTTPPAVPTIGSVSFSGAANQSSPAPKRSTAKVKVTRMPVKGSSFWLTVKVPATGRVTISATGVNTVRRSVSKAGSYRLRVTLTSTEKRKFKRRRKVKLKLRVAYAPASGGLSTVTVSITDKA